MRIAHCILLFIIFFVNKTQYFFITSCVLNGHWGKPPVKKGHEDYNWGTDGETIGPPEPQ